MDFGFSEEQELLRRSVRDFLAAESPMSAVRRAMEGAGGHDVDLWRKMADLGWVGLIVPEAYGGAGMDLVDMIVVLEEMGRMVLPGPFLSTAVHAASTLAEEGTPEQKERYLRPLASGDLLATVALLEPSGLWDPEAIETTAAPEGDGFRLSGTKLFVPDAVDADLVLVAAREPGSTGSGGIGLFCVDRSAHGLSLRDLESVDRTRRLSEVVLDGVLVGAEARLGRSEEGFEVVERLFDRARVALCAEMCGGAQRVLELSVEYAKVREQFGKPIGSFQAIQHRCADMMVRVESCRSATYYAAWAVANGAEDASLASAMAKAYCSDAYRIVAGDGIQVHGGIGFTWEHDMHIYFKRAKSSEVSFGDATWNRERVARRIL